MMKHKKIILLIVFLVLLFLIGFLVLRSYDHNDVNSDSSVENTNSKEYVLENDNYLLGEDLPQQVFVVQNIKGDPQIIVVGEDGEEEITVEEGQEIDLTNKDIISVVGGSLILI